MTESKIKRIKKERTQELFYCSKIDNLINQLKEAKQEGWTEIDIKKEYYAYESEPTIGVYLVKYEYETDKEYEARIEQHKQYEESQRQQYLKLKQQFEPEENV